MSGEDEFASVMRILDGPMCIVTTAAVGEPAGCLVGFSSQVSIDPARFIIGISNKNHTHEAVMRAERVIVHVISTAEFPLAKLFGEQTEDRTDKFSRCSWEPGPGGVPLLTEAPAWFSGLIHQRIPLGDHLGVVIDVDAAEVRRQDAESLRLTGVDALEPGHEA
jgi:flavin reductase (DIM6/NTAB) family NADH-FMN oxidoreductase RutF